jgi:hypothetical protein
MKIWPFVRNDGFEFITHPFSEQSANVDRALKFSVPAREVALPWMTPVRVADTLEDPPLEQAVGGGLNGSLNCMEHDVPDALHCWVKEGPIREVPPNRRVWVLDPDLVALIDAVTPARTVEIALWMVAFGGVTGSGAELWDDGVVGDAQADTSPRAPIKTTIFFIFIPISQLKSCLRR